MQKEVAAATVDANFVKTGGTDEFIRRHTQALKEVSSILEDEDANSSIAQPPPF